MSDKVQIVCKGCEAKLAMTGTPDDIINRKVRCPKCQMKFVARPEMIHVVSPTKNQDTEKLPTKAAPVRKPPRVAEEIIDDDVEILEDDDELPDIPPPRSSKSKRPAKDDLDDDDDFDGLPVSPKKKKDSKPKKKVKKAPTRSFGAAVFLWTFGGIVGGLVGSGLWWVIAYSTGINVWYLSVLTGTAVGAGVRLGAAQYEGWMPATTAVLITVATIFFAKLALNYTLFFDEIPGFGGGDGPANQVASMSEEELVGSYIAETVAPEYRKQGKPVDHPRLEDDDFEDYSTKGVYHPDLWKDAEARWRALPPAEQLAFKQNLIDQQMGTDRRSLIHRIVEQEVKPDFDRQNKPVELSEAELDNSDSDEYYTAEALQEAEKRLDAKSPEQKTAFIESIRNEHAAAEKAFAGLKIVIVLVWTLAGFLWPGNMICLVLACISAYQIGNYDGVTT